MKVNYNTENQYYNFKLWARGVMYSYPMRRALEYQLVLPEELFFSRQLGVHKLLAYSNILETIPVSLFNLKNLAELDLSNNVLCAIPDALGSEMTNLTHLVLRNNMLTDADFPKDFSGLSRSLKYLNLSGNNLTSIPPAILQLTGTLTIFFFKYGPPFSWCIA